jgi:hypothetical protein
MGLPMSSRTTRCYAYVSSIRLKISPCVAPSLSVKLLVVRSLGLVHDRNKTIMGCSEPMTCAACAGSIDYRNKKTITHAMGLVSKDSCGKELAIDALNKDGRRRSRSCDTRVRGSRGGES